MILKGTTAISVERIIYDVERIIYDVEMVIRKVPQN